MRRFLQYLRIAFSAACLVACVLLMGLWVRSYYREDILNIALPSCGFTAWSLEGQADLVTAETPAGTFRIDSFPADEPKAYTGGLPENEIGLGFGGVSYPGGFFVTFPFWFPVSLSATLAAVTFPWKLLSWRYSLRTLLITTTLVAVGLGLIVWLSSPLN
jgi:hypothetical protein